MPTPIEGLWSLDTNILVYATSADAAPLKHQISKKLLEGLFLAEQGCLAGQVLSEFMSVVIRKKTMSHALAGEVLSVWSQTAKVLDASPVAYEKAWKLASEHKYQVWDALIIAICAEHGVKTLYSEDTGSLKRPLGVHVVNPFAELEPT
jgi:predicted nucleic acid-binding protein